jgi:hypothetical protein
LIKDIHSFEKGRWPTEKQVIVLMCKGIPEIFLLKLGNDNFLSIYWLEDEESIEKLSNINNAFLSYESFREHYNDAFGDYLDIYEFISTKYSEDDICNIPSDFPDNFHDILVFSRLEDNYFEITDVLKEMVKTLTHAGKLARPDL